MRYDSDVSSKTSFEPTAVSKSLRVCFFLIFRNLCLFLADGSLGAVDALFVPFHWLTWLAATTLAVLGLVMNKFIRKAEGLDISWGRSLLTSVGSLTGHGKDNLIDLYVV